MKKFAKKCNGIPFIKIKALQDFPKEPFFVFVDFLKKILYNKYIIKKELKKGSDKYGNLRIIRLTWLQKFL